MRLIIHDLNKEEAAVAFENLKQESTVFVTPKKDVMACTGCFGCWFKTPGQCVIEDDYNGMGDLIAKCGTLTLVTRNCFGSQSPLVKSLLDRSISYVSPLFTIRHKRMHHKNRHKNKLIYEVCFYGDATLREQKTAEELVKAQAINLNAVSHKVLFLNDHHQIKGAL